MAKKSISWKTKGMNRDTSVSAFNPEFSFENKNLRLSTNDSNTMMSWVNERGTKKLNVHIDLKPWSSTQTSDKFSSTIEGASVGTAVLNHKLVLFTVDDNYSYIYVFQVGSDNSTLEGQLLHKGNLGFSINHPIETLVSYESENIQKVYWTDNLNQPRVINISNTKKYNDSSFDFVQELKLKEEVSITKIFGSGEFPAGVIQYAFTYYNKHGQESNIFYTTPLQYISYVDRGGSADSKIANSFRIKVTGIDGNFDYIRIYSILRTSKDAVPFCKRVQDIEITEDVFTDGIIFIDTGLQGDVIDPTELLYLGGEEVHVETMEQKDNTLFLGNIKVTRPMLEIKDNILSSNGVTKNSPLIKSNVESTTSQRYFSLVSKEPLFYINTLSSSEKTFYTGAAGFKSREYYRLGVQFQYKNGKWSEPCWIGDIRQTNQPIIGAGIPSLGAATVQVPEFRFTLSKSIYSKLMTAGYKRVRPLMAVPSLSDRTILCQGIGCPTMYRKIDRYADAKGSDNYEWSEYNFSQEGKLYAQSSWLFRTQFSNNRNMLASNGGGYVNPSGKLLSQFYNESGTQYDSAVKTFNGTDIVSPYLRCTEIMGAFNDGHAFYVDRSFATIHSPELIFDDAFNSLDFSGCKLNRVGYVTLERTYGDIDIQTSTPAIGSDAGGFVHRSIVTDGGAALITAPFYNDYLVDEKKGSDPMRYEAYHTTSPAIDFPVYMWQKNGSLNNDVARSNRSAELLKKKISNYRLGKTSFADSVESYSVEDMQLFNSDTLSIVKVAGHAYMGNIETMLTPTKPSPYYIIGDPWRDNVDTDFSSSCYYSLRLKDPSDTSSRAGVWTLKQNNGSWVWACNKGEPTDVGDDVKGLDQWREPISMKYKSTPHIVVKLNSEFIDRKPLPDYSLSLVEITKAYDSKTFMGGTSDDALKANTWIPCGPIVSLDENTTSVPINFKWGDTYVQSFECLKTYAFTSEDKNQVIEVASFMCETRVNIDGRYDRNRMQTSNLNMSPQNFNLMNSVYSQMDNFFSYKMLDKDSYENVTYPNTITWTKTKQNGADIDLWTNITMANTLELDGNKGEINKLMRLNNQLLAFQDSGISQILYNENTQISTTEGVPIEIANSEKVQGKRYYSDTVGCSNKWSIVQTPGGIYFMDSNEKNIYLFNGQLSNLSTIGGFNSWTKQQIPSAEIKWKPADFKNYGGANSFVAYYDKLNQDVMFINKDTALAYSEKFNCFTSFYDYGSAPFFENLDDMGIWVKNSELWMHQAGDYCEFFGENKPYSMTLVANPEPQLDKIFTNLEFRACVSDEGIYDEPKDNFTPFLPFDNLEVWNEYQHGITTLNNRNKGNKFEPNVLARKFRIWRCDIPRDNAEVNVAIESPLGIKRFKARPLDRIRNPWAYLKLSKNAADINASSSKTEIHDIRAIYFS